MYYSHDVNVFLDIFLSLYVFFLDIDVFLDMLFWVGMFMICDGTALTALDEKSKIGNRL